jgi:hypothetical protein
MQIAHIYFTKCWECKPTGKIKGKAKASQIASYVHFTYTLLQCGGNFRQQRKVLVHKLDFLDVNGNIGVMNHLITTKDLDTFNQPNCCSDNEIGVGNHGKFCTNNLPKNYSIDLSQLHNTLSHLLSPLCISIACKLWAMCNN